MSTDLKHAAIEALDFDFVPPCESIYHGSDGRDGSAHEGPAYALVWFRKACCGQEGTGYRCAPIVKHFLQGGGTGCNACGRTSPSEFRVIAYVDVA